MKLHEATLIIMDMIKTRGRIKTKEIVEKTNIPRRRIYDVTIMLNALNLIDIKRTTYGHGKMYMWKEKSSKEGEGVVFNATKIKIETKGAITSISNRGTSVVVEATHKLRVQKYEDYID